MENGVNIAHPKKSLQIFLQNLRSTTKIKVGLIMEIGLEQHIYHLKMQESL